jgi:MFS family permease
MAFWERLTGAQLVFLVNFIVAWGIFFEGWNQGNMGFVNSAATYQLKMGLGPGDGTIQHPTREGGIVAIYYLGGTIGGLWGGHVADTYGRVKAMICGALFVLLGGSLMVGHPRIHSQEKILTIQATAQNIAWMCYSRVIAGFGVGFFVCVIPVWSSEVTSARRRGSHFSLLWCGNFLGIFSAYWVGYGLSFVDGGNSTLRWRLPLALQVVVPAIMIPAIWVMPESPRWLIKAARNDEALRILTVLRGDGNRDHPDVKREYVDILKTIEEDRKLAGFDSYWRLVTDHRDGGLHYARRAVLAFGIQMLVEVGTGIALTTIYAPTVFKQAGFSTAKTGWLTGLNGAMGLVGTAVAAFVCGRWGRRVNLMVGNALLGTWMWMYAGVGLHMHGDSENMTTILTDDSSPKPPSIIPSTKHPTAPPPQP